MMNKIWGIFLIVGILFAILSGNISLLNDEIVNGPKTILDLFLAMFPLMILWSGIMNIAKEAGLLNRLAHLMRPFFRLIFPELDPDDEALGYIASNITINMLGIHNASTPFGLKAMKCLQEKNPNKKVATRSMITFLVLNTGGVTLVATDIIAIRGMYGSAQPTMILLTTILATFTSTIFGLLMDRFLYERSRKRESRQFK